MSKKQFEIKTYQITVGTDLLSIVTDEEATIEAIVGCYGDDHQLMINFVKDGETIPSSSFDVDKKIGTMFKPLSQMPIIVDILRNEKPLFAKVNSDKPNWNSISTGHEPVGEGE